ncbi:carbon monoxide dehydrogenase subunit G [Streptomyces sp. NPDC093225]|uniref:carbon monoxide dehydrogenase subunit G n=1 Tax=Streptomyces sp. NPDC093225 TaxID=3366034 RepID=UPI0037F50344
MEHQVFVPMAEDSLRALLRDPARLAHCVPGLQPEAVLEAGEGDGPDGAGGGSGAVAGRLRVRVAGSTVTYRGTLAVTEAGPAGFLVSGEGTEVRGSGTVTLTLRVGVRGAEDGTWLDFSGETEVAGRAAEFPADAARAAARRLLDRVGAALADQDRGPDDAVDADGAADEEADAVHTPLFDIDVPPSSLDPALDPFLDEGLPPRVPAEAAHARRTMIGRSAEEVDHAPPRGRYAPVPAPATVTPAATLRWMAPAAALAVASAVVVARALRRRR